MSSDRDRLIELFKAVEKDPAITCPHYKIEKTCDTCKYTINNYLCNHTERMVDYLLANGVIVPPCKVGDKVWFLVKGFDFPFEAKVNKLVIQQTGIVMSCGLKGYYSASCMITDFGKTVFLTKEEAEEKLKELNRNG